MSARSVRSILLASKFSEVPVHPVLMLWGPSVPALDDGFALIDGVQVVRGDDANKAWRRHCSEGPIDQDSAGRIASELRRFQAMRDAYDAFNYLTGR
jgi:hypothetical protein